MSRFDHLFRRHGGSIPVAYLRALAQRESSMNPGDTRGPAWGLMQITESARAGTGYSRADLLNPEINVKIATDLLRKIIRGYRGHPSKNLQANWSNPEFIKLLTMGWNAGYSEGGGVGKVATYLEQRGIPVTHDNIRQYAVAAGAGGARFLSDLGRRDWQRSVAELYFQQPDVPRSGFGTMIGAAVAVGLGLLLARYL